MKSGKEKFKVIDLFAGSGGFGLGFLMSNYDVFLSLEIDKWAVDTLMVNNKNGMKIIHDDIRNFKSSKKILSACNNSPDIIIGGPPCQGFSNAGNAKIDLNDPRNSLFKYFAKWVKVLRPKIFIIENVKGILTRRNSKGKKVIEIIENTFSRLGYKVNTWILNAASYGVPQIRERVFIVGNNKNIDIAPPPVTYYISKSERKKGLKKALTVKNAISDLPQIKASEGEEEQIYIRKPRAKYQIWARGKQVILYNHVAMKHTKRIIERFKRIKIGESVKCVPNKYKERKRSRNGEISLSSYNMNNRRFDPDKPAYTIPASFYSTFIHPCLSRNITAREAARLQSFPDHYRFMGKRTIISNKLLKKLGLEDLINLSQYNQIGNAVPSLLSRAIAKHIRSYLIKYY